MAANDTQVGGAHYKQFKVQPWDAILDWGLGYLDGTVVKYLARWKHKNGLEDLKKARHFLDKLIEIEEAKKLKAIADAAFQPLPLVPPRLHSVRPKVHLDTAEVMRDLGAGATGEKLKWD